MKFVLCTVYFLNRAGRFGRELAGLFIDPNPKCDARCAQCSRRDCQDLAQGMALQQAVAIVPQVRIEVKEKRASWQQRGQGCLTVFEALLENNRLQQELGTGQFDPRVGNPLTENSWKAEEEISREELIQRLERWPYLAYLKDGHTQYVDQQFKKWLEAFTN